MPRIFYSDAAYRTQQSLLVAHLLAFAGGIFLLHTPLERIGAGIPFSLTVGWSLLLAYHAYAVAPIREGFQRRTYDRLRNRYGIDWDLAAPPHAFEYEQHKAVLEYKLRYALRDSGRSVVGLLGAWGLLVIVVEQRLPLDIIVGFGLGWVVCNVLLRRHLRQQIDATMQKPKSSQRRLRLPVTAPLLPDIPAQSSEWLDTPDDTPPQAPQV